MCFGQKKTVADSVIKKKVDSLVYVVSRLSNKDLDSAETMANYMLSYSNKHHTLRGIGQSYAALAGIYVYQGNEGKSLAYYIKSADIFESLGNEILFSQINYNIGTLLIGQNQYEEAKVYIQKAHGFYLKKDKYKYLSYSYGALGAIDVRTNKSLKVAMIKLKKAEEFAIQEKDTLVLINSLNLQGEAYVKNNKDFPFAISRIKEAMRLVEIKAPGNHFNLGFAYLHLGKAYWKMGEHKKALLYNDSSLTHYKALNYIKGLKLTYENRKDILVSQGNYKQSIKAFEFFNQHKDSLFQQNRMNQLVRMKTEYETDQIIAQKQAAETKVKLAEVISKQNKNYFISSLIIALLILLASIFYFKRLKARKKMELITVELNETRKRLIIEKQSKDFEMKALKAQMNPHFIFNALNSIQDLVLQQDTDASYDYIVLFAKLIRNTLIYSNQDFIPIEKELDFLKVYLKLEKLRFGGVFSYNISVDGKENLEVPSLLVQPFIENALVHGLMHKAGKKELNIVFSFSNNTLQCSITDNGIGRKKAEEIGKRQGNHHESFALSAIEKRLDIFKKQYNPNIGYHIEDLYENEKATGTKVVVTMPFKKSY